MKHLIKRFSACLGARLCLLIPLLFIYMYMQAEERCFIVTDNLSTPIPMHDREEGKTTWGCTWDAYRGTDIFEGSLSGDCLFRYQGQYEDKETGLYYNRFRYYSPSEGMYISQDPIKLAGSFQVYGYVYNTNTLIDPLRLLAYDVPNTPGVYIIKNGNDCYVGSARIGERGMASRLSDSDHPAAELLNRPGTSVEYRKVNLGTATESSNKIWTESSQRNNILRKYEKAEYEAEKRKKELLC